MQRKQTITPLFSVLILFGALWVSGAMASAEEGKSGEWEVIMCNPLLHQLEMQSTWAAAKAVGVKGLEISVDFNLNCNNLFVGGETPYRLDTPENAKKILKDAESQGLITPVICAPIRLDLSEGNPSAPEWAKTLIENAPLIGAKLIYFPIGISKTDTPKFTDQLLSQRAVSLLKGLVDCGKKHGVAITIENLNVYWNRPEITRPVLAAFQPDELNLCLDPINLYWYGYPRAKVYDIVREYIPRAKHFHVKNVAHPPEQREAVRTPGWQYGEHSVPVADGDLDFKSMLAQLYKSGYKGCVSIEDDSLGHLPKEQRLKVLQQDVLYLREIIKNLRGS